MENKIYEMLNDAAIELPEYTDVPLDEFEAERVKCRLNSQLALEVPEKMQGQNSQLALEIPEKMQGQNSQLAAKAPAKKQGLNQRLRAAVPAKKHGLKKWVSAAVCALIVLGAGSGMTYAATGSGPMSLLSRLFDSRDARVSSQIAESADTETKTLIYKDRNVKYTLDSYWYDQENGILMEQVTVKTLDGTPFVTVEDASQYLEELCCEGAYENAQEFINDYNSGDPNAQSIYKDAVELTLEYEMLGWTDMDVSCTADADNVLLAPSEFQYNRMLTNIRDMNGEVPETIQAGPYFACEGGLETLKLVSTGYMPSKALDKSILSCCTKAVLTSEHITLYCKTANVVDLGNVIDEITVTMGAGKRFCYDGKNDLKTGQKIHAMNLTCGGNIQSGQGFIYAAFDELIDIHAVISVTINGKECLKQ